MATYHKASFKGKIFRHFGFLFSRTNAYKRWIDHVGATNIGHSVDETPQPRAWSQVYDDAPLSFDLSDNPLVSIIIPVYNNWHFTDTCLRSVKLRTPDSIPHEIIVANDCSTDDTKANCEAIPGLRLVTNPHNLGFLRNCNHAVRHARGKYVVLLNNDTEVGPNWLQAMLNVFQNFDRVGVVAGKLIYPNGVVQEAGGIMMKNGWGHPFGRFGNPDHFEFNYVKDVDCAIGACLMIDRDIFDELGGLDERYAPAHYEEFDFEFAVKAAGYRVMYQPATEIIHHESVSGGTDFRTRQSHINHEKFCEKWAAQLASRPETESDQYLARDLSANRKRILLVDDKVPHHDQHAGAVTIFQYVRLLTKLGFQVVYLPHDLQLVQPYTNDLQQLGVEVIYGRFNFAEWFTEHGATFDYCWLCRPDIANQYIDTIRKYGKAKIIYYTHDLHFLREQRSYELTGNRADLLESHRLRTLESKIFNTVDIVLTPSHEEQKTIIEMCPKANAHAITAYMYETMSVDSRSQATEFARRKDLVFLGGYGHAPNVDAVVWFVTDVLPLVLRKIPDIVFHIAGSNVPPQVQALEGPHVNVQGFVPDLEPYFSTFRVFVAPLRYGAGVKGKIVSSLVHGVPVVTTSIGNEGIDLVNGEQALVADGAEEFANLVCQLYNDQATWCKLSAAGIDYINQNFSVDAARITIQAILAPSATTTPTTRTN